ncbi:MAG: sel1 repeat family protein [Muribaculaceae bacterium]|nr:sel1 repeat family protein [Muribaculaceae bacterium]
MTLTDKFLELHKHLENNPDVETQIKCLIENAPQSSESDGLRALMYHEGIGYPADLDKCFELAERATEGGDPLGYFLLGFMCDNAETPDQEHGGPRQKYDHYDAERFYAGCAGIESVWRPYAVLWLGDYYFDSAQGGDPEIAVEYLESIAEDNSEAAGRLSDYYWDLIMPLYIEDDEWRAQLFKWTSVAARLSPEDYSYRMGWLYADGLGCEKSFEKSFDFFQEAFLNGDKKGAEAIAKIYEEYLEETPELSDTEKMKCRKEIDYWKNLSNVDNPASVKGEC